MSEYKLLAREDAEAEMRRHIPGFCAHCPEHQREHGDCVNAGDPNAAMKCDRVQAEIERMIAPKIGKIRVVC